VVDSIQLTFFDVLVKLLRERTCGLLVMPERLLHHDARRRGEPDLRQSLDHRGEQEGRDLEVEDRIGRPLEGSGHTAVGGLLGEVTLHVAQAGGQSGEDLLVKLLARADDGRPRPVDQLAQRPVVHRHSHDRAGQKSSSFEAIQRPERHHPREITGDSEDDEDIGGLAHVVRGRGRCS
jgi:hypothetical protein